MTRRKIGLIGGTFDPIHIGHLIIADRAREQLGLDEVLFLPAGIPPHKLQLRHADAHHRLAMTGIAVAGNQHFSVSDQDVRPDRPSFTVDLLRGIAAEYPDADLTFIIGADSLRDFPTWHDPAGIIQLANFAVASRPDVVVPDGMYRQVPGLREAIVPVEAPLLDISATELRQRIAANLSIQYLVPEAVMEYIAEHGLYRRTDE